MISILLYLLVHACIHFAARCSALMDKVENEIQYNSSKWWYKNPAYWSKVYSANNNKFIRGTKRRRDAWHDAKTAWIILESFAISLLGASLMFSVNEFPNIWKLIAIIVILLHPVLHGINWNLTFNLFYNKIYKRK